MLTLREAVVAAIIILIAALIIFWPQERKEAMRPQSTGGVEVYAKAFKQDGLKAPFDCKVFLRAVGGSAGATSELGLGTTPEDFRAFISELPREISGEAVELGRFREGALIPLAMKTSWGGVFYAFFGHRDPESLGAFTDTDGSLEATGEKVIEPVGEHYLLHLDDAASHQIDDNDKDLLVELWFEGWDGSPSSNVDRSSDERESEYTSLMARYEELKKQVQDESLPAERREALRDKAIQVGMRAKALEQQLKSKG